jgi:polysaccharide biosynthesis transport protein
MDQRNPAETHFEPHPYGMGGIPRDMGRNVRNDDFIDLDRLVAIVMRRFPAVLLCAVVAAMLGVLYIIVATPQYTSSTQILVDQDLAKVAGQTPTPAASEEVEADTASQIAILESSRLALSVVKSLDLDHNEPFMNPARSPVGWLKGEIRALLSLLHSKAAPSGISPDEAHRESAAALLQNSLSVDRIERSFVIQLTYTSPDPALAASIVQAYAKAYLDDQLDANYDATREAMVWMQGRLAELRQNSQAAAMAVEQYKVQYHLTSADGQLMSEQQLSDLNKQLILAQADTASAAARYNQYKAIVDSGMDNAVQNATITSKDSDDTVIADLKTRYLDVTKREQAIENRFGKDHPQAVALRSAREDIAGQIYHELQQVTASYKNDYDVARSREASLRNNIADVTGENSTANQAQVHLRDLQQKADALNTLYQTYLARYEQASQQRSFPIGKARVISAGQVPTEPSSPRRAMVLAFSLVLGLMIGSVTAGVEEFRERFFRTEDDVRAALGARFLGYLPLLRSPSKDNPGARSARPGSAEGTTRENDALIRDLMRVSLRAPGSSFTETLRSARLATDVVLQGSACKVIGIISALPNEGKTTMAANFGGILAAGGARTLLIDADLRNPGLSRMLSSRPQKGLIEAVTGEVPWLAAVKVDPTSRLAILPTVLRGRFAHTSELLSGPNMADLIEGAREKFNYIVLDLPPLAPVIDAKAAATLVDGFIMVVEWGKTPRSLVRTVLGSDDTVRSKLLGVVLNKTDMKKLPRFGSFGASERYVGNYSRYYLDEAETGKDA